MKKNEGIVVKGGELHANQVAVGKTATVNNNLVAQPSELISRVDAMLAVLEEEKNNVENYGDVRRAGETLKDELGKKEPDKNILSVLLAMIANGIPAIKSITEAVKVVKQSIELFAKKT